MNSPTIRRNLTVCAAIFALSVLLSASAAHRAPQERSTASASEIILNVDPSQSTVKYTVDTTMHTVHGAFRLKRGILRIDPTTGKATGEIVVDAMSGQSGNNSRDKRMHKEVLESARYSDIVFRPEHVEGAVQPQGEFNTQLYGTCVLHGSEHELTASVQAELQGSQWKGSAHFSVPYDAWGLKNPGNFILKVNHAVNIEVQMAGSLQTETAEAKR